MILVGNQVVAVVLVMIGIPIVVGIHLIAGILVVLTGVVIGKSNRNITFFIALF